jgi:organic hydroperoxide reductase OsmC/OhrA
MSFILLEFWLMLLASARTRKFQGKAGDGRDFTLNNTSELMPAAKSRCWGQNLEVVAQKTQKKLQVEEQWRCTCSHQERNGAEEDQRQRRR